MTSQTPKIAIVIAVAGVLGAAAMAAAQSGGGMGIGGGGMARWGPWSVSRGDPAAGKAMVAQVCAACHGADGNSTQPLYPRLAGQKESYLYTQLRNFASGQRKNETMAGMVTALDDKAMQNVSAYFSRQQAKRPSIAGKAASIAVGRQIYEQGDASRQIPACANCHAAGQDWGRRVAFPLLAGQHPEYVAVQIRAMRDGTRQHALMMPMIAARASTTDAQATVMKMGDGGFRPAYNIEFGGDTASQIVVGVDVVTTGSDMGQMAPMLKQVVERCGRAPEDWLVDGGFPAHEQIDAVAAQTRVIAPVPKPKGKKAQGAAVESQAPAEVQAAPEPAVDAHRRKPEDSPAVGDWRERMATEEAKERYKDRAATAECNR